MAKGELPRRSLAEGEREEEAARGTAAVVVLGDIGRSPRMQYHARSLAKSHSVHLIGYSESEVGAGVLESGRVFLVPLNAFPCLPRILFLLYAPLKLLYLLFQLLFALLFRIPRPNVILVQNPPSIPSLAVIQCAKWLYRLEGHRVKVIVDWHNFGYTILALSVGKSNPIVAVARAYERIFGRMADSHICVTRAMQEWLASQWDIHAQVLYDQPPSHFRRIVDLDEKEAFFMRFCASVMDDRTQCSALKGILPDMVESNNTLVTERSGGVVRLRDDRPAIIVSGTSWTADEDFSVLLKAVVDVDKKAVSLHHAGGRAPHLLFIITGKGPLKSHYESEIKRLNLTFCHIITAWLTAEDYPVLLGCADLGVSLHTSSSGLDLPMKVVDMFGCGLPVLAIGFPCIDELVLQGVNGLVFSSWEELSHQLWGLFGEFPVKSSRLDNLQEGVHMSSWDENWKDNVARMF